MGKNGFKGLLVWKDAKDLAVEIYKITGTGLFLKDYGLRDQMRRSAVSIPSNIAEGDERHTNKESIKFFYIAKGSLAELVTQLEIAKEIEYLSIEEYSRLGSICDVLGKRLGALISARISKINK